MAARSDLFAVNGTWLRCALHAQTTRSDGEITHARLDRPPESPYGRLEVVDRYGRKAWTNPLWD